MKKFVLNTLPFLTLPLLYVAIGEFYLIKFKEATTIEEVTDIQLNSDTELYYGRKILGNSLSNYKLTMYKKRQSKVITLGQSVTLQFRDFMFEPYQDDFYNTGLMIRNIMDLEFIASQYETKSIEKPELILLGTDFSFVLEISILDKTEFTRTPPVDRATESRSHLKGMQSIFLSSGQRRAPATDFGFGKAGMDGRGYRRDGSYRHKPEIEQYIQTNNYSDGALIDRLNNSVSPFIMPMKFDTTKESRFLKVLARFETMGIELLLYFPPYSDTFFNQAKENNEFMKFWNQYMTFQDFLITKGYNVIPFTTPSAMGLSDDYMIDAEHPGEVLSGIQLYNFCSNNNLKNKLLDKLTFKTLDSLIQQPNLIPISFLIDEASLPLKENNYK